MTQLRLTQPPAGLVLTPGANADRNNPTLVAIDEGLKDLPVKRLTLGTTSIASAAKKIRDAGEAFAVELGVSQGQIAYGGRSFGGRACSVAVAQGLPACALVLLSYPLHPPGKADKLRVDHFGDIPVPTLFVSGDKDPFGTPQEFATHTRALNCAYDLQWVTGNHSPKGQEHHIIHSIQSFFGV